MSAPSVHEFSISTADPTVRVSVPATAKGVKELRKRADRLEADVAGRKAAAKAARKAAEKAGKRREEEREAARSALLRVAGDARDGHASVAAAHEILRSL